MIRTNRRDLRPVKPPLTGYERRASDACYAVLATLDSRGVASTVLELTQDYMELAFGERVQTEEPTPELRATDAEVLDAIRRELRKRELTLLQRGRVLSDLTLRAITTGIVKDES